MLRKNLLRQLAKTDFYAFQEYVFGYKPAPHIRQMVDFVEERIAKGENGVVSTLMRMRLIVPWNGLGSWYFCET